jgi:hypothetical protein
MSRPAVLAALASLLVPRGARAQTCDERPNAMVADLGLHVISAGYQRTLGCFVTVQASVGLYSPWMVNSNVLGLGGGDHDPPGDVLGFALRGRAFVHPFGTAPGGLWISPYAQAGLVGATRAGVALTGPALAAGLSVGWTWRLGARWLLALGVGAQYHTASFDGSAAFPGFARVAPTVDINVGYRF